MKYEPLCKLIRKSEGLRLKPYLCPAGIPTIGYGHTGKDVTMKSPAITSEEAERLLQIDVQIFIMQTIKLSPILVNFPDKLCAIADFIYNLGSGRYKASTLKRKIDTSEWEDAGEELKKWVWGGGKKLPGLIVRRNLERAYLLNLNE